MRLAVGPKLGAVFALAFPEAKLGAKRSGGVPERAVLLVDGSLPTGDAIPVGRCVSNIQVDRS
jgi:hypothetical protein